MRLAFTIPGTPQQQGSKTRNRFGGGFHEDNAQLKAWRRDALAAAGLARGAAHPDAHAPTFVGPVHVVMRAYFLHRASDYGTGRNARTLKPTAPIYVSTKPDLDKLQRALGDVLEQSGVVKADQLIARWEASKQYDTTARVEVVVRDLPNSFLYAATIPDAEQEALI